MTRLDLIISGTLLIAGLATTAEADRPSPDRERRRPPAAAFTACEKLRVADACSFTGRNERKVEGTCQKPPQQERLVCRPANKPAPRDRPTPTPKEN